MWEKKGGDFKFICTLVVWHNAVILNLSCHQITPRKKISGNTLESIKKSKIYLLEYCFDSNNQELLEITKNMSKDVEGDSQLKFQVCKRKKIQQFLYENEEESL